MFETVYHVLLGRMLLPLRLFRLPSAASAVWAALRLPFGPFLVFELLFYLRSGDWMNFRFLLKNDDLMFILQPLMLPSFDTPLSKPIFLVLIL